MWGHATEWTGHPSGEPLLQTSGGLLLHFVSSLILKRSLGLHDFCGRIWNCVPWEEAIFRPSPVGGPGLPPSGLCLGQSCSEESCPQDPALSACLTPQGTQPVAHCVWSWKGGWSQGPEQWTQPPFPSLCTVWVSSKSLGHLWRCYGARAYTCLNSLLWPSHSCFLFSPREAVCVWVNSEWTVRGALCYWVGWCPKPQCGNCLVPTGQIGRALSCSLHVFSALYSRWNVGSVRRINESITTFRVISSFFPSRWKWEDLLG